MVAGASVDPVVSRAAHQGVSPGLPVCGVVAPAAVDGVVAAEALDGLEEQRQGASARLAFALELRAQQTGQPV